MAKTDTGRAALEFLSEQRLPSTPSNYTVAYLHIGGGVPELDKRIKAITDGGVRIVQDEADELARLFGGVTPPSIRVTTPSADVPDPAELVRAERRIRHQLLRIADIAASSGKAASDFGHDLRDSLENLDPNDPKALISLVSGMIERAAKAEEELANTNDQLDQMRQELEAAKGDASRDALTGLYNRRAFERHLAEIGDKPRSIAFVDVDHFKKVNDTFGHAVGDRVLKQVATLLQKNCSEHFVARWGGEEFVICFFGLNDSQAAALVDRSRADMAARQMQLRESGKSLGQITFSAGVSDISGHEQAIAEADRLLYEAKNSGRNRVLFAQMQLQAA